MTLKIKPGKIPSHGLLSVDIPYGADWRRVKSPDGTTLESQWIPAPFDNNFTSGRLLVKAPAETRELSLETGGGTPVPRRGGEWATVEDGRLIVNFDDEKFILSDKITNRPFDNPAALEYNIAFDAQKGAYPLFNGDSVIETVSDGDLASVIRIKTPLKEEKTGDSFHGAVAAYDLIKYTGVPLLEIDACFSADAYALVHSYAFSALRIPLEDALGWAGGMPLAEGTFEGDNSSYEFNDNFLQRSLPKFMSVTMKSGSVGFIGAHPLIKVEGSEAVLIGDVCNLDRDIREYGPGDGFRANLVYLKPGADKSSEQWTGELPQIIRPGNICVLAGADSPAGPVTYTDDELILRAGALKLRLRNLSDGVDLVGVCDEANGDVLLDRGNNQLFSLLFRETDDFSRQHMVSSLNGWGMISIIPGKKDVTILFSDHKNQTLTDVSVALHTVCDTQKNRVGWEVDVRNVNNKLSLIASEYPSLYYNVEGSFNTFCNQDCGRIRKDMAGAASHIHYRYPAMSGCMQYQAVWRDDTGRGLYFGVHDSEGVTKHLFNETNNYSNRGNMRVLTESIGTGEPANSQKLPGTAVWQLFDGDWYDASMIYREWALPNARWVPRITASEGRADTPKWMREIPVWFNQSIGDHTGVAEKEILEGKWADELIECQKDLGVPIAVHVYNWHQIPFDNDYPHYKPAKLTFMENIERLHDSDVKVMPYINCRLWDTRDRKNKDWKFTKEAKPYATTTYFGEPYLEQYVAKEVDGSPVRLAPMCPTTALWQEKTQEICDWLMNEIGVDAIYLDQIGAGQPVLCMNKNHGHRPGNGSWWQDGYQNLLEHLRRRTPVGRGYTTEANAEIYMRIIDSYLTWGWVEDGQVPSFPAVYGGYVNLFGRSYSPDLKDHLRILAGQSLLFGEQIGWIRPASYLNSPYRALYRKIVRTRHKYAPYFAYGHMSRPPVLTGNIPSIVSPCHMGEPNMLVCPAAMGAMWRRNDDGSRIIILENLADVPVDVNVRVDLYGTATGEKHGDLSGTVTLKDGKCDIGLPAQSIIIIEIAK